MPVAAEQHLVATVEQPNSSTEPARVEHPDLVSDREPALLRTQAQTKPEPVAQRHQQLPDYLEFADSRRPFLAKARPKPPKPVPEAARKNRPAG